MSKPGSRTVARFIVLLFLLTGLALAVFLATLDLNSYRKEIASTLSDALNRSVTFSQISFSMAHGLAIDCSDLKVEASEANRSRLNADHLYLKIALWPLLRGELILREVILARPRVFVDLTQTTENQGLKGPRREAEITAQLGEIHVHEGEVKILTAGTRGPQTIQFKELDLMLQERPDNRLGVEFSSRLKLNNNIARLSLEGEASGPNWPAWQDNDLDLELTGTALPLDQLGLFFDLGDVHLSGHSDAALSIRGSARKGLSINSEIEASSGHYSHRGSQDKTIGRWQLQGTWQHPQADVHRLTNIDIGHKDLHLAGSVTIDESTISAEGGLLEAPLASLLSLTPDSHMVNGFGDNPPRGQISLTAALTDYPLKEFNWLHLAQRISATASLDKLSWQPPDMPLIENANGRIELAAGQLNITHLQGEWQGRPQTLSGSIDMTGDQPIYNLQARLLPPLIETGTILTEKSGQNLQLSGELPIDLAIQGPGDNVSLSLHAGLTGLAAQFGPWYEKKEAVPGELNLQLNRRKKAWRFANSYLEIDDQRLDLQGQSNEGGDYHLKLLANDILLDTISQNSQTLSRHNLRGRVSLDLELSRSTENAPRVNGRLSLNNVGIHLTSLLADIQRANGSILFHGGQMKTVLLNAHLGESPITLQAELPDFNKPALKLHLKGKSVRADELVFNSREHFFRDLDGRLTIDASGISFDRVKVNLDGGTDCIVTGAMDGWHHPNVALNVDAAYGNIDEIIHLWDKPEGQQKTTKTTDKTKAGEHKKGPSTLVVVDVVAEQGHISRLKFERATGTVISDGSGLLTVFPLQFHVGEGHGNGQVVADSTGGKPTTLKVSGHLENFPASGIHKDLLQRDSLVTGTLRGDFYLEGLAGAGFTRTANGGVNIEVKDGVLKKFQFLSKVFSVLNVSQLFSLQLPDMAEEGMPFVSTAGTFSLSQGLLQTEDLLVHSEAMDLSLLADYDILTNRIDGILGVKPLKTVDKIITKIPIAGWLLTGEDKALVTAHFTIKGDADNPEVLAVPVTSLSSKVFGIFKRVLTLPGDVITDPGKVILPQSVNPKE